MKIKSIVLSLILIALTACASNTTKNSEEANEKDHTHRSGHQH